ncbi:N-acetylmuramoyl-L-alanine amidase [Azospirillum rugosum]|uniref:N-acetylmuramoyl-L-alanine amidase n=1 Tax=Azospirillum rugosum TaxID=416170 RepID=A0ABS4SQJ0_9PROT|nr:N-acetylmuramoyl-L-alanine amidase [Azospirillum rugosum]MBP2294826.1 N-acetylmuramoyl-L-alanine amidase [Azospirillum rugosum]MDQ0528252.1 N-acetylmuramoyl-L-alanine amidase [Azospirillum rugosum]
MARMLAMIVVVLGALAGAVALTPCPVHAQTTAALPFPPPAQERVEVLDARLGLHPDKTRLVLELSESVAFAVSVHADPYRVVVNLPDVSWPGGAATVAGKGLVTRYRFEGREGGASRLVVETTGPVKVSEAFTIPSRDGHKPRFVLDVVRATAAEFAQAANIPAAKAPPARAPAVEAPQSAAVSAGRPVPAPPPYQPAPILPAAAAMTPPIPQPAPQRSAPNPDRAVPEKPLVVIDPGHGGVDPGAIGVGGIYEKDITLAMAREVKRQLEGSGRYRVKLTRDKDVFIRLRDRVAIARDADADLFLSLHADSIGASNMRGLSIYTLSDKASDREAENLAAKENRADALAGMDLSAENDLVATILIDLAQRDTMNHSKRFANLALDHLRRDVTVIPNKPIRQAGFAVLTAPDMPSALVEMGYLSSPQDAGLLTKAAHRERFGRALLRAIDSYFKWLGAAKKS